MCTCRTRSRGCITASKRGREGYRDLHRTISRLIYPSWREPSTAEPRGARRDGDGSFQQKKKLDVYEGFISSRRFTRLEKIRPSPTTTTTITRRFRPPDILYAAVRCNGLSRLPFQRCSCILLAHMQPPRPDILARAPKVHRDTLPFDHPLALSRPLSLPFRPFPSFCRGFALSSFLSFSFIFPHCHFLFFLFFFSNSKPYLSRIAS